ANKFSKQITTNKDGVATLGNLPWGSYTVKETVAPVGYKLNEAVQTVNINNKNVSNVQKVTVTDGQVLGQIQIVKTNEAGNKKLAGAEFTVTGPNKFSKTVTTDKNGVADLSNLAWGTYTIKETKAPVGYNLNSDSQQVVVNAGSVKEVQKLSFKDSKIKDKGNVTVDNSSPDTGDRSQLPIYVILILSSIILLSINRKKMKIRK
ncbi:MAG: MSCRAMM family protein, partial [Clostridium sp.]